MYSSTSDPLATRWAPLGLWWGALVYASLYPAYPWQWSDLSLAWVQAGIPRWWTWPEVLANVAAYLVLGFLATRAFARRLSSGLSVVLALLLGLVTSGAVEWMQSALPARIASALDLMANAGGTFVGGLAYLGLRAWTPAPVLALFRPWVDGAAFLWVLFWAAAQSANQVAPLGMGLLPFVQPLARSVSLPEPFLWALQGVIAATGLSVVLTLALSLGRSTLGRSLVGGVALLLATWWLHHEWQLASNPQPVWVWATVVAGLLLTIVSGAWRDGLAAKGLCWQLLLHLVAVHAAHALSVQQAGDASIQGQGWLHLEHLVQALVVLWPWMVVVWSLSVARLQSHKLAWR